MIIQKAVYQNIDYHFRAANYLTTAQLFLRDNFLLKRKLRAGDFKPVVLGHWGACPGINFLYSHFCRYIQFTDSHSYIILGSGHAAPALLANLYLERSLGEIYSDLDYGDNGMYNLISRFGIDPRLQTEVSPALPGIINAGGELGIALSCAVGSILNNPQKSSFCVIGDGEFEVGATMPSLLSREFLVPKRDGFLILAINLNQYKMGSRSILSTWSNNRIKLFFSALGMRPFFCNLSHNQCATAFLSIAKMRENWVNGISSDVPVIILKSPKGATGPAKIDNEKFMGTHHSHKVGKLKYPTANRVQIIEHWLRSYRPEELFQNNGFPVKQIENNLPKKDLRIGRKLEIDRKKQGKIFLNKKIIFELFKKEEQKLGSTVSPMKIISNAINRLREKNKSFILFSPDEGASNGLESVAEKNGIKGNPNWESSVPVCSDGGIIEILNENCCHGMLQGYNQTGRDGLYVTYEAFAPVNASLISQYYKFLKISNSCKWRAQVPSLKYILTSLGWRNCYTHQNPDLLNTLLSKTDDLIIDVYFPSDANQALACFAKMFTKRNSIQVQVVGKTNFKTLRSIRQAHRDVQRGFWTKSYGLKNRSNKKFYIVAIGDYMVKEAVATCDELIRQHKNLYIKIIAPVCSEIFYKEKI